MTGLAWLVALGLGAMALMIVLQADRKVWSLLGSALMLGATGYALQGSPSLPARPATAQAIADAEDPGLDELRDDMLGRYSLDFAYMIASDAMRRGGNEREAVQWLLAGLNRIPRSFALWTALGTAYAAHDADAVSPPALFAFQQAMRLAPRHPAPPFFLGMAYVRANDFAAARPLWARAVALSPERASYRRQIAFRLALLDGLLAEPNRPAG